MLSVENFNAKYKELGLKLIKLTELDQYELFKNSFSYGLDFRITPTRFDESKIAPFFENIKFDPDFITTETWLLFEDLKPVGVCTLIVEPYNSLKNLQGFSLSNNVLIPINILNIFPKRPDYVITRGWRVLDRSLRNRGIGADLRKVITDRITYLVNYASKDLIIYFLGMVASSLNVSERTDLISSPSNIDFRLLGMPSRDSLLVFYDYMKDGFTYVPQVFFPRSFGPVFYKELKS